MTNRKKCIVKLKRWITNYKALLLCIFALFCIIISPWLFTKPAYFKSLVFYDAGTIGDTIGGITAPFIGFTSVILLFWTLNEQVKINKVQKRFNNKIIQFNKQQSEFNNKIIQFNEHQKNYTERQDEFNNQQIQFNQHQMKFADSQVEFNKQQIQFNEQQKKFNDATRILSIETFISKLENNITFGYSTPSGIAQGRGLSDLNLINNRIYKKVGIAEREFDQLFNSIVAFQNNLKLLYNLVISEETKLEATQLELIKANLLFYYQQISTFYSMIKDDEITIYPVRKDTQEEKKESATKPKTDPVYETYKGKAEDYLNKIPTITLA